MLKRLHARIPGPQASGRDWFNFVIGTGFGLGLSPLAPGTAGALLGIPIFWAIVRYSGQDLHSWLIAASLVATGWANNALTPWAERFWKKKDPGNFILDEIAGFLMTVLLFRGGPDLWATILWAFLVTRVLDIIKVPPARQLERIPGGWGILLDDLMSSVYAAGVLHLMRYLQPQLFGL